MDKIYYLITALFFGFYGVYFLMTKQWIGGFVEIIASFFNIKWFIREIKRGGIDES